MPRACITARSFSCTARVSSRVAWRTDCTPCAFPRSAITLNKPFIQKLALFSKASPGAVALIALLFVPQTLAPAEILLLTGQPNDSLFLVRSGRLTVYVEAVKGEAAGGASGGVSGGVSASPPPESMLEVGDGGRPLLASTTEAGVGVGMGGNGRCSPPPSPPAATSALEATAGEAASPPNRRESRSCSPGSCRGGIMKESGGSALKEGSGADASSAGASMSGRRSSSPSVGRRSVNFNRPPGGGGDPAIDLQVALEAVNAQSADALAERLHEISNAQEAGEASFSLGRFARRTFSQGSSVREREPASCPFPCPPRALSSLELAATSPGPASPGLAALLARKHFAERVVAVTAAPPLNHQPRPLSFHRESIQPARDVA